jgi:ASC-1-like (ASCH) protein
MKTLTIPLKGIYFDQIKAGTKPFEYRVVNDYWNKRIRGRAYDQIVLTKGYPASDDHERRLTLPWRGVEVQTIQHEHFGPDPVLVYAIRVSTSDGNQK